MSLPPAIEFGRREVVRVHDAAILLPGPFVVLQGMPGDGMPNTIDTMPLLDVHGNKSNHRRSRNISCDIADGNNNDDISSEEDGTDVVRNVGGGEGMSGSVSTLTSFANNDTPHDASDSVAEELTVECEYRHVNALAPNGGSEGNAGDSSSVHESEELVFFESISSASSSGEEIVSPSSEPGSTMPEARPISTHINVGLHLPTPASAVAGMGYNTLLPSLMALPPTMVRAQSSPAARSQILQPPALLAPEEDAFVVVQNAGRERNTLPSVFRIARNDRFSSQSPSSSETTSSSPRMQCRRSQNPQFAILTPQERRALRYWRSESRLREARQRDEMLMYANPQSGAVITVSDQLNQSQWWKRGVGGNLAVFDSLPTLSEEGTVSTGTVVGDLPPGSTIVGMEMTSLDCRTFQILPSSLAQLQQYRMGKKGTYQFLRIESPMAGYVLFSIDRHTYLGPGLPSYYVEPRFWTWRVTCPDGAFVRQGLELTSVHVDTIPHGAFLRVTCKTVNSMGLSRLRIEAVLNDEDSVHNATCNNRGFQVAAELNSGLRQRTVASTASFSLREQHEPQLQQQPKARVVVGWVSEFLNPLSGQRGLVVQPVPYPVPAHYRVTLREGAVIRANVELSSPQIGYAPLGSILTIVGRAYSEHPGDHCIERLMLSGGGGWISSRLNRPPPMDELVVELMGIDGSFDPGEPGLYHLEQQRQVMLQYQNSPPSDEVSEHNSNFNVARLSRSFRRIPTTGDLSSINDEDDEDYGGGDLRNSGELSNTCSSLTGASTTAVPTLYRSGVAGGSLCSRRGDKAALRAEERCLICLTEERTATMVHGETGHIACCLTCARILKARGDRCPVCRMQIDSVIQQFWA